MTITNKILAPLRLYCGLFGHHYEISKKVTLHVKEYTCTCCNRQLTTDGNGDLIELTPKFQEINSILEYIYTRRKSRSQEKSFNSSIYLRNAVGY